MSKVNLSGTSMLKVNVWSLTVTPASMARVLEPDSTGKSGSNSLVTHESGKYYGEKFPDDPRRGKTDISLYGQEKINA